MKKKKDLLIVKNCVMDYRINRGWSRRELAHLVGSSEKTIEAIENDLFCPSVYLALCLAAAFDCHVDNLFKLEFNDELCYR